MRKGEELSWGPETFSNESGSEVAPNISAHVPLTEAEWQGHMWLQSRKGSWDLQSLETQPRSPYRSDSGENGKTETGLQPKLGVFLHLVGD